MKISWNWLSRYLTQIPDPEKTAEILTLAGLEVEEISETGPVLDGIVVGEVLDVRPHPNADKLVLCQVNNGEAEPVQIVCGAPNVATGQKVPVALPGSVLPMTLPDGSPFAIRKAKIRGELSSGMICAEDELGLGDDHSGIMVLEPHHKPGTPLATATGVRGDTVFEIGLTPNRPDATCHLGVARDLAAVTGAGLLKPFDGLPDITGKLPAGTIRITDTDKCHRYAGILIQGITVGESPDWLRQLLLSIGLRPINNVVDITNFVLHELGQPLHAFDYDLLADGRIDVKSFPETVAFTTLDEEERKVPPGSLFICDGEKPVALAGIMGGLNSEIAAHTTNLLIESAWFEPAGIRRTAKSLAMQTDSSYRFERGVDPDITAKAALRCASLILEHCGGKTTGMADIHPVTTQPATIPLRHERLNSILGVALEEDKITGILNRLEITTTPEPQSRPGARMAVWNCQIPTFRPDITGEIDLIEEVARIFDYNKIPDPAHITMANPRPIPFEERFREQVRRAAAGAGLNEIYTNSLLPETWLEELGGKDRVVQTMNPITRDQSLLRTQLLFGFLKSAAWNFNRGASGVAFFEIGNIFRKERDGGTWIPGIHESTHLHIGLAGTPHSGHWKSPVRPYDFFDLKARVESILRQIGLHDLLHWQQDGDQLHLITTDKKFAGTLFMVSRKWKERMDIEPDACSAELDLRVLEEQARQRRDKAYRPVSRFPAFEFDLALVVEKKVPAGDLLKSMHISAGSTLRSVDVFDVFEGGSLKKHQKSIAFRLLFQDNKKTLTIRDVEPVIHRILRDLGDGFGAELRS